MACSDSFLSCHREKHRNHKLGRDPDQDKRGCIVPCPGNETNPNFLDFRPQLPTFTIDPRVIE